MQEGTITLIGSILTVLIITFLIVGLVTGWEGALFIFLLLLGIIVMTLGVALFWVWIGEKFGD